MAVQIVVDSSCDITKERADQLGLTFLPLKVLFSDAEYVDGITLGHREFFQKLAETGEIPKTGQVTPVAFEQAFREALDRCDEVVSISIASALSGTFQSSQIAADQLSDEERSRVFLVDSESVSVGEELLIRLAISMRDEGKSAKEIYDVLQVKRREMKFLALLDTMENLKKGGRISPAVAAIGGLLSVKPLINISEGVLGMHGTARGMKGGYKALAKYVEEAGGIDYSLPFGLSYGGLTDDQVQAFLAACPQVFEGYEGEVPVSSMGTTIGTHAGPGSLIIAFFARG